MAINLPIVLFSALFFASFAGATVCGYVEGYGAVCGDDSVNDNYNMVNYGQAPFAHVGLDVVTCIKTYGKIVYNEALLRGVASDIDVLFKIIMHESHCKLDAAGKNSESWDCGLMQINNCHASGFPYNWPANRAFEDSSSSCYNPVNNIKMGVAIFAGSKAAMGGDVRQGICAYAYGQAGAKNKGAEFCNEYANTYLNHPNTYGVPGAGDISKMIG